MMKDGQFQGQVSLNSIGGVRQWFITQGARSVMVTEEPSLKEMQLDARWILVCTGCDCCGTPLPPSVHGTTEHPQFFSNRIGTVSWTEAEAIEIGMRWVQEKVVL